MQQINLYTDEFRPRRVILTLDQIALMTVALILLLGGSSGLMYGLVDRQQAVVMAKKQKQEQLQARVAIMQKEADAMILDQGLVQTNTRLAASLQARIDLLDTLGRVVVQQGERFSATLVALARQRIDDLWLTRIELNASGQGLTLEGLTPRSQAVPQYLQRLREEASFRGRTFNLFHLSDENKEGSPVMSFVLRSEVADHFQPFEMSSDPQERPLISPQAEQDLLQQMRGVKP